MRKAVVFLILILVLATLPPISGQFLKLQTTGEIAVLRGDYSSGTIQLTNAGGMTYKVVSYQRFWVEDANGNTIGGFNLTLFPKVFSDWRPRTTRSLSLNISCAPNVSSGNYKLHIRFLAFTSTGSMYILYAEIPLHVIGQALEFEVAEAYVKERPSSAYALNGETIVVFSHVNNIAHRNVTATGSVSLVRDGRVYFSRNRTLVLVPGDNLVKFEVPVGYDIPEGTYRLDYTIRYPSGEYAYSKKFQIKFGVTLVGVSLQSDEVSLNAGNTAYLTLLSERVIDLNLTVEAYRDGELVSKTSERTRIVSGTTVLKIPLPTNVSGRITAWIKLSFDGVLVGTGNVTYTVSSPPVLKNVSYERTSKDEVTFKLTLFNPSANETSGVLAYRISTDDGVLYKDSVTRSIPPGSSEVTMKFEVPLGKTIYYEFSLTSAGKGSTLKGKLFFEPIPSPTTTTSPSTSITSPTSSTAPSNTTVPGGGSSGGIGRSLAILALILLLVGVWYYMAKPGEAEKKHVRPKPKRRSPLGRFRRPKRPEFKENKELPKKK